MKVLVAEDYEPTRIMLQESMRQWGHDVTAVDNGDDAWEALCGDDAPRIAVLDWMMPGAEGVDICRRLKERQDSTFVYAILLTCRDKKSDRLEGYDSGAHDFIVKPVDRGELRTRIAVGERIVAYEENLREANRRLSVYGTEMEKLAEERALQLRHADRLSTLGTMSACIAHELNNPITVLSINVDCLDTLWSRIANGRGDSPAEQDKVMGLAREEMPSVMSEMTSSLERMTRLAKSLTTFASPKKSESENIDLNESLRNAVYLSRAALTSRTTVEFELEEGLPMVYCNQQEIEQVLINLLTNAAQALDSSEIRTVRLTTKLSDGMLTVFVEDTGPGISEEALDSLFNPFFTTKSRDIGTGLGLMVSKMIVEGHGGTIHGENRDGGGARFVVKLPASPGQD